MLAILSGKVKWRIWYVEKKTYVMVLDYQQTQCWLQRYAWSCIDWLLVNTMRSRQNVRHLADDTFKRIFFDENVWSMNKISLKFVPKGSIDINSSLAWRRADDKPLSEPMVS